MSSCPKGKSLNIFGVLVTSHGKVERTVDRIGAAEAVLWVLHKIVVVNRELSRKAFVLPVHLWRTHWRDYIAHLA